MKENNSSHFLGKLLLLLLSLSAIVGIIFLKRASEQPAHSATAPAAARPLPIAVPDTTLDTPDLAIPVETVAISLPDTIGKDKRPPYEAGYEDGYISGMDDGSQNADRATYDDSSNFPLPAERNDYARGYSEGYARGFKDGREGRQFNI